MIHLLGLTPSVDEILELPSLELGRHYRGRLVARHPAGKATNVARALGHLGVRCRLVGFLGAAEAALFRESLRPLGVECAFVPVEAPTRRSTTLLVGASELHVNYPSFAVRAADLAALGVALAASLAEGDLVALSGGLPEGLDAGAIGELLSQAHARGARLYVDSSGRALAAAVALSPEGVRINAEELAEWVTLQGGQPSANWLHDAATLARAGVRSVMISRGAEGALLLRAGADVVQGLLPVEAHCYAVGAGDAQLAGWLAALASGAPDARAELARALGVAAASVHERLPGVLDPALAAALERAIVWR